jgi:hypothetical protein
MTRFFYVPLLLILVLFPLVSPAKRSAPKPVAPVQQNGVLYSAPNDDVRRPYVVASDATTGRELWRLPIFETKIKPDLEEDVQWVFIIRLWFKGNDLVVRDEKSRCYRVDVASKAVEKVSCFWNF